MDKKFRRLYLHKTAFNLVPQQLFCTKAKNITESRKRNMILISLPSRGMCCTLMVHFIGVPIKLEKFFKKHTCGLLFAITLHFNNYYKYKTDFIYLSLNHPRVKTIISFVHTC